MKVKSESIFSSPLVRCAGLGGAFGGPAATSDDSLSDGFLWVFMSSVTYVPAKCE